MLREPLTFWISQVYFERLKALRQALVGALPQPRASQNQQASIRLEFRYHHNQERAPA